MRLLRTSLYTLLAFLPHSPVVAQTEVPIGSRIPRPVETNPLEPNDSVKVRELFTACVYEKRPQQVEALLAASDTLNVDYEAAGISPRRISPALSMPSCLSKATSITDTGLVMKMSFPSLRGMLLEQSYRAHNPMGPSWISKAVSPPVRRFVSKNDELARAQAAAAFADCIVAAAPREADALIRAPAGSAAEKAALAPLVPHLAPCISAGMEVRMSPAQLRMLVADGLWTAWRSSSSLRTAPAGGAA